MRARIVALFPIFFLACSDHTVAFTSPGSSSGGSSSGGDPTSAATTSAPSTTTSPTTGLDTSAGSDSATDAATDATTDTTTSLTSDSLTTSDPSAGSSSSGEPGSNSGTTTGSMLGCGMDGTVLDATLEHLGFDPGCGPLEFIGTSTSNSLGPVYSLDGCPCDSDCLQADPWTFTFDGPPGWLPGKLPACPRIVVERTMSKKGCELVGVAIWDTEAPADSPALFHAGSLLGPVAAAIAELKTEQIVAETCECGDCCDVPTRLDLKFSIADKTALLAEGEEVLLGGVGDPFSYHIKNFQSHLSGICDDSPHIDWAMKRVKP